MASRVGHYLLFDTLGTGTFAKVKRAVDEKTGEEVAMKIMEKESIASMHMTANVRREIAIMKALTHDNIVRLRQVLASPQRLYLVMDFVQGGELFTKIHRDGALTENEGRHYFRQLVAGVAYCHSRGVVHRDLKPENLLLDSRTSQLKIADFGLSGLSQMAAGVDGEQLLHTQCGSPNYCAPEILEPSSSRSGYNGALVDTWSVGVILYVLLAGRLPFYDPDPRRLYEAIATSVVQFPASFPEGAADIVRRLLVKEPTGRMSLEDVQKHPWFLVGLEQPSRRRQRRSRPQASSGSSSSSSTSTTSTATVETIGDEAVQAMPPRSSLPTSTLGTSSRRLSDVDPPEAPARDAELAGRAVVHTEVKPPRPMPEADSPEEVTVLARRNGWGDTYPRERRSSSPTRRDGQFVPSMGAGMNGTTAKTDGESGGALRSSDTHSSSSDGPVPAFEDKDLVETPDADQRKVPEDATGSISSNPASPSVERLAGQAPLSRSHSAGAISPAASRNKSNVRGPPVTRLAGRPPRPSDSPLVPIRDLDYTSPEGPTLSVVDDAELDREENELRGQGNTRPVRAASGGSLVDGASDRFSVAPSTDFDREVSMFSDALASSVISGTTPRPSPPTRAALPVTSVGSTQFGNRFASGDTFPRDSAVTSHEPSSRVGEWRDSIGSGSGSGDTYRSGPRTQASPGVAKRADGRVVPALPSLGGGAVVPSSSGQTAPPSLAELSQQGRLSVGGTGQSVAWAQDDSRRGRAGVRSLLGLTGSNEPPSFVTALPARECLRTIGTILSDMRLTVFLKKNQNKMKCQVGLLRGLPMWASICYVESGGSELNSVVFKRAREDHSRFDHVYLVKLCNSVHTQYRHAVEMSAVRAAEAARDQL